MHIAKLTSSLAKGPKEWKTIFKKNVGTKMYGHLLSTTLKVTTDQGNLIRYVIKSWHEDLLNVDHLRHDKLILYAHRQVDEQPTKRSKKNDDKSAVDF